MHEKISHIFYTQTAVIIRKSESDSWLLHNYGLKITSCRPSKQSQSLLPVCHKVSSLFQVCQSNVLLVHTKLHHLHRLFSFEWIGTQLYTINWKEWERERLQHSSRYQPGIFLQKNISNDSSPVKTKMRHHQKTVQIQKHWDIMLGVYSVQCVWSTLLGVRQLSNYTLTLRLLMSYIYGAHILDVPRSHTTTHHSR